MIKALARNVTSCCNNIIFEFNGFAALITTPFSYELPNFSNSLSKIAVFFSYSLESCSMDVFLLISCTLLA